MAAESALPGQAGRMAPRKQSLANVKQSGADYKAQERDKVSRFEKGLMKEFAPWG